MRRWLIAHDEIGYHVRETLCVTHDGPSGEAIYHTQPRGTRKSLRKALALARKLEGARKAVKG